MAGPFYWSMWIVILSLVVYFLRKKKKPTMPIEASQKGGKLPPGPRALPILGNLLVMLRENPHHELYKLAQCYGPIMHLRLGRVPVIVVSTPEAAEQFLKTHDLVFASRPRVEAMRYISWEDKSLIFAPYGAYWRSARKMCVLELLSAQKVGSFRGMRREEVGLVVDSIRAAAREGTAVDVTTEIKELSINMSCRMVLGKNYMDEEFDKKGFQTVIHKAIQLSGTPCIGDYVPYLGALDLQGLRKRGKAINKELDTFFEKIIEDHIRHPKPEGGMEYFVDVMIGFLGSEEAEYRIERSHIKAIMLDMLVASMDTGSTVIDWTMSELLRNPCIMRKVQEELETVVGLDRHVEESDLENLHYLNMVVKESLRLHPPAPFLGPHEATQDCNVDGFHIPRSSRVFINAWAIGRDQRSWPDHPEKFWPERFEKSDVDVRGYHFQLIPFGSGRRGCPGVQLGWTLVRYVLAQLVHCFDWELPEGMLPSDMDMTEKFAIATARVKHLLAIPSYRLKA